MNIKYIRLFSLFFHIKSNYKSIQDGLPFKLIKLHNIAYKGVFLIKMPLNNLKCNKKIKSYS